MQISFVDALPKEMQLAVFERLAEKDLAIAALVSRKWRTLAEDPMLWKKHVHRRWRKQAHSNNLGWKKIYQKKHVIQQKVETSKCNVDQECYQHIAYQLPAFAVQDAMTFQLEKKVVFIKNAPGNAQLYALENSSCRLVFSNLQAEQTGYLHYQDGHLIQLTQTGAFYRWPINEEPPLKPLAWLGHHEEVHVAQDCFILVQKDRQHFKVYDIETGSLLCLSPLFSSAICMVIWRALQGLIQCVDGSLYFLSTPDSSPLLLEGSKQLEPLVKELVLFDAKKVIILKDDGAAYTCQQWDASSGRRLADIPLEGMHPYRHLPRPSMTISSYAGDRLAVGLTSGRILFYELPTGKRLGSYPIFASPVHFIKLEQDRCIAAGQNLGLIRFFDFTTPPSWNITSLVDKRPEGMPENSECRISGIAFNERRGACCTKDGWLDVWDFAKVGPASIVLNSQ